MFLKSRNLLTSLSAILFIGGENFKFLALQIKIFEKEDHMELFEALYDQNCTKI